MLQSIKRAHHLDSNNPDLHSCIVRFLHHTAEANLDGPVAEVIKRQTIDIYSTSDPVKLNDEFLNKNNNSLPHLLQAGRMLYLLDSSSQVKALSLVTGFDNLNGVTLKTCTKVFEALRNNDFGCCDTATDDYMKKCQQRFPYATAFRTQEQKIIPNHQDKENSIQN